MRLQVGVWGLVAGCTFGQVAPEERPIQGDVQSSVGRGAEPSLLPRRAIQADRSIPPVSGGTLEANDEWIVAADPVRDVVWIVRYEDDALSLSGQVDLPRGSEPGRVLLDGDQAWVVLRGAGSVARVDLASARIVTQADVCEAPRGIDARREGFVVACVGGSLVFLDETLRTTGRREVTPDLRDVVVEHDDDIETIWVSTFREARVLEIHGEETIAHELPPLPNHIPRVAWRMQRNDDGGVDVLHEQMSDANFTGVPLAYYGSAFTPPSSRIVRAAVARLQSGGDVTIDIVQGVPLAVDFRRNGGLVYLAAAYVRSRASDQYPGVFRSTGGGSIQHDGDAPVQSVAMLGDLVVSFSARNGVLLTDFGKLQLSDPVIDTGHDLFHATTPAEVTCASCHPAGRDDAYVWIFNGEERRTQPLTGGILASAPYHWGGELADLEEVAFGTFDTRMDGPDITPSQVAALGSWLDGLPTLRVPPDDLEAVARGQEIYGLRGCADCHDLSADPAATIVRSVQAPPLFGVGVRNPFFRDGCALTLVDAIGEATCASGHPVIPEDEVADVVAYLEQL